MSFAFDEALFGFDCNLLQHDSDHTLVCDKLEKQHKDVLRLKKKTIATNTLIRKYYAQREQLAQTEKILFDSKENSKKICIDFQSSLEKCLQLEQDNQYLQRTKLELETQLVTSKNRAEAAAAHSHQLQQLVKEYETRIEGLQIEKQLDKDNVKNCDKKYVTLNKEYGILKKQISILCNAFRKKNVSASVKTILDTYKKSRKDSSESCFSEENRSDVEYDIFDNLGGPPPNDDNKTEIQATANEENSKVRKEINNSAISKTRSSRKDDTDRDSDFGHEAVSVDTGRGSSLAFSDSEKCFPSPEYFISDSPLNSMLVSSKQNDKEINHLRVPLRTVPTVDRALSPIIFENVNEIGIPHTEKCERATNTDKFTNDVSTSPIKNIAHDVICNISYDEEQREECLESNYPNTMLSNNSFNRKEVQRILDTMRFTHELITPIPGTPNRSIKNIHSNILQHLYALNTAIDTGFSFMTNNDMSNEYNGGYINSKLFNLFNEGDTDSNPSIADIDGDTQSDTNYDVQQNIGDNDSEISNMNAADIEDDLQSDEICNVKQSVGQNEPPGNNETESLVAASTISDHIMPNINHEVVEQKKKRRYKKITRLEKLRINLAPKGKIRNLSTPIPKRLRGRPKQLPRTTKKHITRNDTAQSLNDKSVYEKAVKVMAELNALKDKTVENVGANKSTVTKIFEKKDVQSNEKTKDLPTIRIRRNSEPLHKTTDNGSHMTRSRRITIQIGDKIPLVCLEKISFASYSLKTDIVNQRIKSINKIEGNQLITNISSVKSVISNNENELQQFTSNSKRGLKRSCTDKTVIECSKRSCPENPLIECKRTLRSSGSRLSISSVESDNKKQENQTESKRMCRRSLSRLSTSSSIEHGNRKFGNDTKCKRKLRSSVSRLSTSSIISDNRKFENETEHKRILRSFTPENQSSDTVESCSSKTENVTPTVLPDEKNNNHNRIVDYSSISMFSDEPAPNDAQKHPKSHPQKPQDSILCCMIRKYVKTRIIYPKKTSDAASNNVSKTIEDSIANIIELPQNERYTAMDKFTERLQKLDMPQFIAGLIKYLSSPDRSLELVHKIYGPPAPSMTYAEQILLYVLDKMRLSRPNDSVIDWVLNQIEYTIFRINKTPEFKSIETLSHFYALLCRRFRTQSRLRLFIMDAMYCIHFKAIPLIKQCLDVWMHILPLAHMGIAKSPLVTCLVYLLHFFKCDDKYNRVTELRRILHQKYFYTVSEWNETKIIELFKNAIKEMRDNPIEKKMLRKALIILAKRKGPEWCQKYIFKNILLPFIDQENVPERVKIFCVSMMGPLVKPYPVNMKVHCEVVMNQLVDMLDKNPSPKMQEAIYTSLIFMSKHNQNRVVQSLLLWSPEQVSPEMELIMKDFVREKPLKIWKIALSKMRRTL